MNPETHIARKVWSVYIDDQAGKWLLLGSYWKLRAAMYRARLNLFGGIRAVKIVPHFHEVPRRRRRSLSTSQTK